MTIKQVEAGLRQHPDIKLAYVFGSVAKGTVRSKSDVDVAVYGLTHDCRAADSAHLRYR
ncbi:nucleotidyltransferase domain-containing protein [Pseudomonas sp. CBC3]|uniref:nucleotidyltransferase domain-containing protein n=1 Tax=Pseudomonas sp. CBC3 TaxID=3123318 RepID=UPI004040829F